MPIHFTCACGKAIRVKDELAGRKGRCPACAKVLTIPSASAAAGAEDEASDYLLAGSAADSAEDKTPARPKPATPQPPTHEPTPPPVDKPGPRSLSNLFAKKVKKGTKEAEPKTWSGGIAIHPSILAGIGMMAGAAIWFFVGLAAGIIYFYPPILFCLGIAAIIGGFRGTD